MESIWGFFIPLRKMGSCFLITKEDEERGYNWSCFRVLSLFLLASIGGDIRWEGRTNNLLTDKKLNLKKDMNELIYKTKTDSQTLKTKLWSPKGKGGEEEMHWGFGIGLCTPLYVEWMVNEDLYSTGNSIFCDNLYGKRIRKRTGMCIHMTVSLCCTAGIITTL